MASSRIVGRVLLVALLLLGFVGLRPGCINDRKQMNEHQRVLDSEKD